MKKIVITGGPCAGKTSIVTALKDSRTISAIFVPEAATLILSGGFPAPPEEKFVGEEQFDEWMREFQGSVYHTQLALESLATKEAELEVKDMVIHDRGLADCIAYHPEGLAGFACQFGTDLDKIHARYDLVIFLESLAITQPELFGRVGNQHRYESVENAIEVNSKTHDQWSTHKNFHHISSQLSLEEKTDEVSKLIRQAVGD